MRRTLLALACTLYALPAVAAEGFLVTARSGEHTAAVTAVESAGGTVVFDIGAIDLLVVSSDSATFLDDVAKSPSVKTATLDARFTAAVPVDVVALDAAAGAAADVDEWSFLQWNLEAVDAAGAWEAGYTGAGVRVCILDEGVDPTHSDLADNFNSDQSMSFVPGEEWWAQDLDGDGFSHGTHVAGIVAAADNDTGLVGVAPGAEIVSYKVLSEELGYGEGGWIIYGMAWAGWAGCDVINMSLGGEVPRVSEGYTAAMSHWFNAYKWAVNYATSKGATVVVSAGNSGIDFDHTGSYLVYPAGVEKAVTVSATGPAGWALDPDTDLDEVSFYTNYGKSLVDVAAPGGNVDWDLYNEFVDSDFVDGWCEYGPCYVYDLVLSTCLEDWYCWAAGTSMAAPHVAGVAALAYEALGADATPARVRAALRAGADDLGKPGRDAWYGQGRVNAAKTVE